MTTPQDCNKLIQVTHQNGNNYCRILSLLGMEEEGDPVAEVERLIAAARIPATQVGGVEPVAKPAIVLTLAQSNDFDPDSIAIRIWNNVGGLGVGEHTLYAAPQSPATPEPMLRFCPGCGSVGEVAGLYLDCCPDGSEARVIPAALANKCRSLFQMALADALTAKAGETPQTGLYSTKQATEPKQCWSADEEEFCYDTLHELLLSNDQLAVGDPVYVGDAITPDPSTYIDADIVLEQMGERASDDCGEYAEGYPDVTPEAKQSLDGFLKGWARKHCTPVSFYKVEKVRQHILTAADLAT